MSTVHYKKKQVRTKKYATPEAAHQAQIIKMREWYQKNKEHHLAVVAKKEYCMYCNKHVAKFTRHIKGKRHLAKDNANISILIEQARLVECV